MMIHDVMQDDVASDVSVGASKLAGVALRNCAIAVRSPAKKMVASNSDRDET